MKYRNANNEINRLIKQGNVVRRAHYEIYPRSNTVNAKSLTRDIDQFRRQIKGNDVSTSVGQKHGVYSVSTAVLEHSFPAHISKQVENVFQWIHRIGGRIDVPSNVLRSCERIFAIALRSFARTSFLFSALPSFDGGAHWI